MTSFHSVLRRFTSAAVVFATAFATLVVLPASPAAAATAPGFAAPVVTDVDGAFWAALG